MKKSEVYKEIEDYYKTNRLQLIKKVLSKAGSVPNAEDIVQEAFTRALTYYNSYVPGIYEFSAWFGRILSNSLKDFKREERSRGMAVEFDEEFMPSATDNPYYKKLLNEIIMMIEDKAGDTRHILHLYFVEQYKPADIAKVIPVSNGAIRAVVFRFKVEVKEKYGESLCC